MSASQPIGRPTFPERPAREPDSQAYSEGFRAPAAPDATPCPSGAVLTVTLSPAELLILRLIETAKPDHTRDQVIGIAVCTLAAAIGVPTLARDFPELDLADVPLLERADINRFRTAADHAGVPP